MTLPLLQSFIHGRYLGNSNGETFPAINPATGETLYLVEQADDSLVQ